MSHFWGDNGELLTNFQAQFVFRRLLFLDSLHKWSPNKEHVDFFFFLFRLQLRTSISRYGSPRGTRVRNAPSSPQWREDPAGFRCSGSAPVTRNLGIHWCRKITSSVRRTSWLISKDSSSYRSQPSSLVPPTEQHLGLWAPSTVWTSSKTSTSPVLAHNQPLLENVFKVPPYIFQVFWTSQQGAFCVLGANPRGSEG